MLFWLAGSDGDYHARCGFFKVKDLREVPPAHFYRWQAMLAAVRKFQEGKRV